MSLPLITEKAKEVNSGSAHYPSSRYVEAYNHYNSSNISMIGQQNRSKPIPQKDVPYAQLHNPCFCKNIPISGWNDPLIDPMVVSPSCIEKDVHITTHTYLDEHIHSRTSLATTIYNLTALHVVKLHVPSNFASKHNFQ